MSAAHHQSKRHAVWVELSECVTYAALTSVQHHSRCHYTNLFMCDLNHGASSAGSVAHWPLRLEVSGIWRSVCLHQEKKRVFPLIGEPCAMSALPQFNQYGYRHWLVRNCCLLQIQRGLLPCVLIQLVDLLLYCSTICLYLIQKRTSMVWQWKCVIWNHTYCTLSFSLNTSEL